MEIYVDSKSLSLLENTIADPFGSSATELLLLLNDGVFALAHTQIPVDARRLLSEARNRRAKLSPGIRHLLLRLSMAGLSPGYDGYMAVGPLTRSLKHANPQEVMRRAARTVDEMVVDALNWRVLAELPDRQGIERRLESVLQTCDRIHHGVGPATGPTPDVIRFTLLPESSVGTERFFIRTTQSQEVIFAAAATLAKQAASEIAFGHVVAATHALHSAATLLDELLPQTFRILQPLTLDDWVNHVRPRIEKPSAIQSRHYRSLAATLSTLHSNFAPHRIADMPWEAEQVEAYQRVLGKICRAHQRWYAQHAAIVRRYTPGTGASDGLAWLTERLAQIACVAHPLASQKPGKVTAI